MKTLDVESLSQGIKTALAEIKSQKEQLKKVEADVKSIENLHTALTGKGGQAIRSFYGETHKPLLAYYDFLFENYERVLKKMKKDLSELEPEKNGVIKQSFLESELTQGLNETKNYTSDLTDEANGIIDTIKSIAPVRNLDDSGVAGKVSEGKKDMEETIKQLTEYDQSQTSELTTVEQDVEKLTSYVNQISGMYDSGKLSVGGYVPGQLSDVKSARELNGDLAEKRFMHLGNIIASPLNTLNEKLGIADAALIATQIAGAGFKYKLAKKLTVRYRNNIKPQFWDRIKGNYEFTVSSDRSLTSKGKHRDKTAKFLINLMREENPSNSFRKMAQNFVNTYDSPSHLIKHAFGFPKNSNGWINGKGFQNQVKDRVSAGSKDVVKTVFKAGGLKTAAKFVPGAATAVSFVGNAAEMFSPENSRKTVAERIGRSLAGVGTDMVAIGAGAKIGAIAGTAIGGPVGTVIGGAVGGLVGGVASTIVGDKVKDAGEKIFGAGEKLISKGINTTVKSVTGWFN
ncbi:LXG domain-containing protein [Metabacillus sp. KIGAM252]|uniref:LXG domain-containing protein n=1 Tax=Metabacillus flavus TaxID=2823519 RepID=A0ABS5LJ27_9BACI|nr:LXG domain-containing protein [Metabacillus flavus]MBS2970764.1 LXG domain-containing protein [Metabacillus flavus]